MEKFFALISNKYFILFVKTFIMSVVSDWQANINHYFSD